MTHTKCQHVPLPEERNTNYLEKVSDALMALTNNVMDKRLLNNIPSTLTAGMIPLLVILFQGFTKYHLLISLESFKIKINLINGNRVFHGCPQCNCLWRSSSVNDQRFHYGIDCSDQNTEPKMFGSTNKYYGNFCCVPECSNQRENDKINGWKRSYYRFAKVKDRKQASVWMKMIGRGHLGA